MKGEGRIHIVGKRGINELSVIEGDVVTNPRVNLYDDSLKLKLVLVGPLDGTQQVWVLLPVRLCSIYSGVRAV